LREIVKEAAEEMEELPRVPVECKETSLASYGVKESVLLALRNTVEQIRRPRVGVGKEEMATKKVKHKGRRE
jgi:hypothetical protein